MSIIDSTISPHILADPPEAFWLIRFSSLGDVIVMSTVVEWLHKTYPKTPIFFITRKMYANIYEEDKRIKQVFAWRNRSNTSFLKFIKNELKPHIQKHKGVFVDLHNSRRSKGLRLLLPLPTLYAVNKHRLKRLLLSKLKLNLLKSRMPLCQEAVHGLKNKLGHSTAFTSGIVKPIIHSAQAMPDFLKLKLTDSKQHIGIIPSAAWLGKRWPSANYIELIKQIHKRSKFQCLVFGGPDDQFCTDIAKRSHAIDLTGKLSIPEVATTMKSMCRAVIGNDTGLIHLANASDTPTCVIYGPTSTEMGYEPIDQRSITIGLPLWCRPCSHTGYAACIRFGKRPCLNDLSPEFVFEQCKKSWKWLC